MPESVAVPPGLLRIGAEGLDRYHITSIRHLELEHATRILPVDFVLRATLNVDQEEGGLHGAFRLRLLGDERLGFLGWPAEGIEAGLSVAAVLVPLRAEIDDAWIPGLPAAVRHRILFLGREGPRDEQRIPTPETGDLGLQGVEVRCVGRCVPGPGATLLQSPITRRHQRWIFESLVRGKEFLALRMMPAHDTARVL